MEKILAKALGQDAAQLPDEEKRMLLSRLLARFAHEVRNPLSSLDVHLQLLEEDLSDVPAHLKEKTAARFEIIRGELHRLEAIVKHFLSLAGPSSLHLELTDPTTVLQHVCELLRPEASARGIQILLEKPEVLPSLELDPVQITQALVNLLINAIQAIDKTGQITVRAYPEPDRLSIEVRDTGPGLASQQIFEPFFTTKPNGSGLGLWIVQQIVSAHGGVIHAGNAPSGGAVFKLQLPLHRQTLNE